MIKKSPVPAKASSFVGSALGAAVFGAIVGGTAAAARGIRDVKSGKVTAESAALDTAREAGSTAIAAGAAAAVVCALPIGPFLSTLGIVAVATGTKYAMDSLLNPGKPAPAPARVAPAKASAATPVAASAKATKKAAPKKAAAKKTTAKKAAPKKAAAKKAPAAKPAAESETKTDKA